MKNVETKVKFEKGACTAGELVSLLKSMPPEAEVKIELYFSGHIKTVRVDVGYENGPQVF